MALSGVENVLRSLPVQLSGLPHSRPYKPNPAKHLFEPNLFRPAWLPNSTPSGRGKGACLQALELAAKAINPTSESSALAW